MAKVKLLIIKHYKYELGKLIHKENYFEIVSFHNINKNEKKKFETNFTFFYFYFTNKPNKSILLLFTKKIQKINQMLSLQIKKN